MKTITEFPSLLLKNAAKTRDELVTQGKTPEELPQSLGESLKIEGERLGLLMTVLEMIGESKNKKLTDLKRAVVFLLSEGEKPTAGAIQKEAHSFLIEYYPPLVDKNSHPQKNDDGHHDRKSKGKKGKGQGRGPRRPDQGQPRGKPANIPQPKSTGPAPIIRPVVKST